MAGKWTNQDNKAPCDPHASAFSPVPGVCLGGAGELLSGLLAACAVTPTGWHGGEEDVKVLSKDSDGFTKSLWRSRADASFQARRRWTVAAKRWQLSSRPLKGADVSTTQGEFELLVSEISLCPKWRGLDTLVWSDEEINVWRVWESPNLRFINYICGYSKEAGPNVALC